MFSLIQAQEAAIARMLQPRTSERRAAKNRGAALRALRQTLQARGYPPAQVDAAVQDTRDVYDLRVIDQDAGEERDDGLSTRHYESVENGSRA